MLLPSYVENTLYSTTKYSCVRRVHTLYSSYFVEHNGDDEPHEYFANFIQTSEINSRSTARFILVIGTSPKAHSSPPPKKILIQKLGYVSQPVTHSVCAPVILFLLLLRETLYVWSCTCSLF